MIVLPDPFCRLPARDVKLSRFSTAQTVFHQGAAPEALFFVGKGEVNLVRHTQAGQAVVLHRATSGEIIAEASLFSKTYHCDCVAQRDSELVAIGKAAVLTSMASDTRFAAALVERMAGQIQRYRRRLELQSIGSAEERVLAGLSDGWLTSSVMQFSGDLGLSHEATYRALAALVTRGVVQKTGRGRYQMPVNI